MFVNEMGWRRGRTAFASSDHLVSREGSYHATVNGTCRPFGLTGVHAADELSCTVTLVRQTNLRSRGTDKHRQQTQICSQAALCTHTAREKKSYTVMAWSWSDSQWRGGDWSWESWGQGWQNDQSQSWDDHWRGQTWDSWQGQEASMGWPAGDGSPELSPMTSGSRKARRGKKKKGKKKKESNRGNPGSIGEKVAVTRVGSML